MRIRWKLWRYFFAAIALVALVRYVGAGEILSLLARTRPGPLLLFLAGTALAPALFGLQIGIALRIGGNAPPLRRAVLAATNAWALGTLTPARAGDLSLAILLQPEVRQAHSVALVIADKVCSILVLALLACVSAFLLHLPYTRVVVAGVLFALTSLSLVFVLTWGTHAPVVLQRLAERLRLSLPIEAYGSLRSLARTPQLVAWFIAASFLRWIYICGVNLFIFSALSQAPSIGHVIAGTAVGRIVSILPISIGGIGLKEPVQIPIYRSAGVPSEAVVAASLLGAACSLLVAALYPLVIGAMSSRGIANERSSL